jgi:hypothetical protein
MQHKKRTVRRRGHAPYTKAHMGFRVRKNKTNHASKYVNKKKTLKRQNGGGDDVDIYYKKPGIFTFGKIEASTDAKTGIQSVKSKQLYELPQIKINTVGTYRFELGIKNYVDGNDKTYNSYGRGYSSSSNFEKFAEYKHKHNKFMANEKTIVSNIDNKILDRYIKKYKQISMRIKVYKLEKNEKGESYKEYKIYYFNLEPKD